MGLLEHAILFLHQDGHAYIHIKDMSPLSTTKNPTRGATTGVLAGSHYQGSPRKWLQMVPQNDS